jgi:hypothetical protein
MAEFSKLQSYIPSLTSTASQERMMSALRSNLFCDGGGGAGVVPALMHESGDEGLSSVVLIHQHSGFCAPCFVIICHAFAPFETSPAHAVQHAVFDSDSGSSGLYFINVRFPFPFTHVLLVGIGLAV